MPKSDALRGYAWGLAGTVCLSTVSILSKLAYRTVSRDTFMVTMYISGVLFAGGYIVATGRQAEKRLDDDDLADAGDVDVHGVPPGSANGTIGRRQTASTHPGSTQPRNRISSPSDLTPPITA